MKYSDAFSKEENADRPKLATSAAPVTSTQPATSQPVASKPAIPSVPEAEEVKNPAIESPHQVVEQKTIGSVSRSVDTNEDSNADTTATQVVDTDPITTKRQQRYERDDRRIRSAQEAKPKDTYYRKEYGWIMSDADVANEQQVKKGSDANTNNFAASIETAKKNYEDALATAESKVEKLYKDAIPKKWEPPGTRLVTYSMPEYTDGENFEDPNKHNDINDTGPTTIDSVLPDSVRATMEEALLENGYAQTDSEGNIISISSLGYATVKAYQDAYNEDLAEAIKNNPKLRAASIKALETEKRETLEGIKAAAKSQYDTQMAIWNADMSNLSGAYAKRLETGKKNYEDSVKRYSDSVIGINAGLLE